MEEEKRQRGRPRKDGTSKPNNVNDDNNVGNNTSSDENSSTTNEQFTNEDLNQTKESTVNVPSSDASGVSAEDLKFDNSEGFNDIPEDEFDILGETTEKRSYSTNPTSGTNTGNGEPVSEDPIAEPVYSQTTQVPPAFKNDIMGDMGADTTNPNPTQPPPKTPEQEKLEKEAAKANSNLRDLTPNEKRDAAQKTARGLTEAYCVYVPLVFKYIAKHDTKKLEKLHKKGEIDIDIPVKRDGTTFAQYVNIYNDKVDEAFTKSDETKQAIETAVYDVLMEKDIAMTPMQRLLMVVGQDMIANTVLGIKFYMEKKDDMETLRELHEERMEELRKSRVRKSPPPPDNEGYTTSESSPKPPPTPPQPEKKTAPVQDTPPDIAPTMETFMNSETVETEEVAKEETLENVTKVIPLEEDLPPA